MYKILVTVDFSVNSRKSVRFALQLASQINAEVIFFHVVSNFVPTSKKRWDYAYYTKFQKEQLQQTQNQLIKLVEKIYTNKLTAGLNYSCDSQLGEKVGDCIIAYAKKHKVDFICAGARGTNLMAKFFGNTATNLITKSPIPIIIIPNSYRLKPLKTIHYASDMQNLETELKKVLKLSTAMRASLKIIHFNHEFELKKNKQKLTEIAKKYKTNLVKFLFKKLDTNYFLTDNLKKSIEVYKPSLVVLFTKQNRKWFDRLLLSSQSTDLSFTTKTPLLIFRKSNRKKS